MSFQVSDFKLGDRVRIAHPYQADESRFGTVVCDGPVELRVHMDGDPPNTYSKFGDHWNATSWSFIREIVEAADGYRKVGGRK